MIGPRRHGRGCPSSLENRKQCPARDRESREPSRNETCSPRDLSKTLAAAWVSLRLIVSGVAVAILLAGCGNKDNAPAQAAHPPLKTPADPLTDAELEKLLAAVQAHSGGVIPEFEGMEGGEDISPDLSAADLASEIRDRFRKLFNPEQQGALWSRDDEWKTVLKTQNLTPGEFAALVKRVSCGIMRVRLEARIDIDQLQANARAEVKELTRRIEGIDEVPPEKRTREATFYRTQSAIHLSKAVALQEFAELVRQVPSDSSTVIRRYSRQLKALLPSGGQEELLAELQKLGAPREALVIPAGFEESDQEPQDERPGKRPTIRPIE